VSACAGVLHYYWLVKSAVRKPLMYAAIVAILLAFRLFASWMKSRRTTIVGVNS
jgi:methionine sulfoxide reductase heme-binding subunit